MNKKAPAFHLEYPKGSKELEKDWPSCVLKIRIPGGFICRAGVTEIPKDMSLIEIGPEHYASLLKPVGSKFKVISNEEFSLRDSTGAYRTEIKWLYQDGFSWVNTIVVSAYKDDKWVYSIVNTVGDPSEIAWIAESLSFD